MKLGLIIYGALEQVTGGYVYDRLVVEGLRRQGVSVEVLSCEPPPNGSAAAIRRWAEHHDLDVVVGDELCHALLAELFANELAGAPRKVLLVHHLEQWESAEPPADRVLPGSERTALLAADLLITTSAETARRLSAAGVNKPMLVAEPGADRLPFLARRQPSEEVTFLFVANLLARKRVLELLAAFEAAEAPNARLRLVGSPEREPEYARSLREFVQARAELVQRVEFAGTLVDGALAKAYADADCLVSCSLIEGYGMGITEALYAGLPAMLAPTGCALEFADSGAIRLLDVSDGAAFSRALTEFAADRGLREQLTSAAARLRERLPRWDDTARRWLDALSDCA